MHQCFNETGFQKLDGPGKQIALLYFKWKITYEINYFKERMQNLMLQLENALTELSGK